MPGIEDWKTRPYNIVQKIFEENKDGSHEAFVTQVEEYFNQRLNEESISKISSLNHTSVDLLAPGSLVRYRCMVQDVFDPQFCLGQYIVRNKQTQETRLECGTYRDMSNVSPHETVDMDSQENKPVERLGFYCVPIPGEADWVKQVYSKDIIKIPVSSSKCVNSKRKQEDDESATEGKSKSSTNVTVPSFEQDGKDMAETPEGNKTQPDSRPSNGNATTVSALAHNFPLPNETGTPCILRVYSNKIELKTTDAVEVIGILSVDPALASISEEDDGVEELIDREELRAHEPPPSLVPRIHVLTARMVDHNNPYLPPIAATDIYKSEVNKLMQDVRSIRLELHSILQHALLGDGLAAEYLLCHLFARVYARADTMPLGKMSVNLSGCPITQRYSILLYHLISQLTTKSALMEMSIENMNSWRLIPKKDYTANRVAAGMLQLSAGTQVVLDETALQQGQLDNTGVMNVRALEDMITWQKVEYDFQWSAVPIQCDINVLILSECTSLLSKDVHVPMVTESVDDIPSYFTLLDKKLTEEVLSKLRSYITVCKHLNYQVSEEVQKAVQDDFVETRQANPSEMSIEDFQKLLTLFRLLTVSYGLEQPTFEVWMKAKEMEQERKARVAKLPKPSNGTA